MKLCTNPFNQIYVMANGGVKVCGWATEIIGNLLEQSIEEIWHSEAAKKQREAMRNGLFDYCRKNVCPFCINDTLADYSDEQRKEFVLMPPMPVRINMAHDRTCNIACPSCRNEIWMPSVEDDKRIRRTNEQLLPVINEAVYLDLNGIGEVFAGKHSMELLKQVKPVNKQFHLAIETNGVLADEAHWDQISNLHDYSTSVVVTVNSLNRETYKYLSGGFDHVDRIVENLRYMSKLREKGIINYLCISAVVQESNFREMPELVERCFREFNIDQLYLKSIFRWFDIKNDAESYWFKDIFNPMHPYHRQWKEIKKDPRLDSSRYQERLWWWGPQNDHPAYEHPAKEELEIQRRYLHTMGEIAVLAQKGAFRPYLDSRNIQSVYIYAAEQCLQSSECLTELLKGEGVQTKLLYSGFESAVDVNGADCIVVMDYMRDDCLEPLKFCFADKLLISLDVLVAEIQKYDALKLENEVKKLR